MKLTLTPLIAALTLSTGTLAAPAPSESKSMMVSNTQWTITNLKRVCTAADTKCTWAFGINNGAATTPCTYVVNGSPASQANGGPGTCGKYTVTSGWSGQFGPNNGFTTLSVVNQDSRQIVWPAYTDAQVKGGKVVKPDQAYTPAALP
ncbi:hypothetical protein BJY04DRAFT_221979 [Aspergillus karnatakaensis]|uniref:uncharacterized protein n=1 Tax=Aspergillus karnatakaensis TaxID=1810916 RepID=UPI003CCDF838